MTLIIRVPWIISIKTFPPTPLTRAADPLVDKDWIPVSQWLHRIIYDQPPCRSEEAFLSSSSSSPPMFVVQVAPPIPVVINAPNYEADRELSCDYFSISRSPSPPVTTTGELICGPGDARRAHHEAHLNKLGIKSVPN